MLWLENPAAFSCVDVGVLEENLLLTPLEENLPRCSLGGLRAAGGGLMCVSVRRAVGRLRLGGWGRTGGAAAEWGVVLG